MKFSTPGFNEIEWPVTELLSSNYSTGTALDVKTTTPSGMIFGVSGLKTDSSILSDLTAKYSCKGVSVTQTWTSNNVVGAKVVLDDPASGISADITSSLLPKVGATTAKAGIEYKQDYFRSRTAVDYFKGPTFYADGVVGSDGLFAGSSFAWDCKAAKMNFDFALGFISPLYSCSLIAADKLSVYSAAYTHTVNPNVEAGAKAVYKKDLGEEVAIEVGAKVLLDSRSFMKAKCNNKGLLGLSYSVLLRDGVQVGVGASVDTTKLSGDMHTIGMQLSFVG